jgi:serine/threonine-protein kinase RsbW
MSGAVLLRVPAALAYRELASRTVAAVAKLSQGGPSGPGSSATRRFTNELLSAVGEAFNNIVIHAYAHTEPGAVEIELTWSPEQVVVEVRDTGASFDFDAVPLPDLEAPQEKGMGVFIIRSFVDEAEYRAGCPNVLVLTKRSVIGDRSPKTGRGRSGHHRLASGQ